MKARIATLIIMLSAISQECMAAGVRAEDKVRFALSRLKSECDLPDQSNQPTWGSYLSATEQSRNRCIAELKPLAPEALPLVRTEWKQAKGEYRQMLAVMLATLGDEASIVDISDIILMSKYPATRVCAAWGLRAIKDKRTIDTLKKALRDPYIRWDGGCVPGHRIRPVTMIASDALVEMGVPFDEVRRLRGDLPEKGAEPGGTADENQPMRSETNQTSGAAGSRR